jgi:hypothetical protein
MQLNPATPIDADAQRIIDDLYWNSTSTAKSIAERFGLTSQRITKLVTPLSIGTDCWWCRRSLTWTSRSERSSSRDKVCAGCGAQTSLRPVDGRLQPSNAAIVLTTSGHRTPKDFSTDVDEGVAALAAVGLSWSRSFVVVDVRSGPRMIRTELVEIGTDTVVISSVRALGVGQGDAFGAFRLLLQAELRVITARDVMWATTNSGGHSDRCSLRWSEYGCSSEPDLYDDWSPAGRGGVDEYRVLGFEDTSCDREEFARQLLDQ